MFKKRFKTAFILGAGKGERLKPLTDSCPKPLLEIRGRPVITYAMEHLADIGVERFIVNTHHLPDAYRKAFPESNYKGIPIIFRYEPMLLDTGGGLKNIEDLLSDDEAIICYNGDLITNLSLKKLIDYHEEKKPLVTLALRSIGPNMNVEIDKKGNIIDMRQTFGVKGIKTCLFTGVYAVESSFLTYIGQKRPVSVVEIFLKIIQERPGPIKGIIIDEGFWYDIGTKEAFFKIKEAIESNYVR